MIDWNLLNYSLNCLIITVYVLGFGHIIDVLEHLYDKYLTIYNINIRLIEECWFIFKICGII